MIGVRSQIILDGLNILLKDRNLGIDILYPPPNLSLKLVKLAHQFREIPIHPHNNLHELIPFNIMNNLLYLLIGRLIGVWICWFLWD
jgi:hypothetical protein